MTDHDLSEGDVVYDNVLEEEREVDEVKSNGTVIWVSGITETASSVEGNLERGEYIVQ